MGRYDDTCWNCRELCSSISWKNDDVNGSRREIRCNALHYGVDPFQRACYRQEKAGYSDSYIQECIDAFYKKCNYYIVSACTGIIDMPNASAYLDAFKEGKDVDLHSSEVVTVFSKFGLTPELLLEDYDVYGKAVADQMYAAHSNPETKEACENHIRTEIIPELDRLIGIKNAGHPVSAILGYISLTRKLMTFYGIEYQEDKQKSEESPVFTEEATSFGSR